MDLFTPVVESKRQNPNFTALISDFGSGARDVLREWADGFTDRDRKFVKEFQTTFNASFWELYLHAVFKELGLSVDFRHHTPDFALNLSGRPYAVAEAVIASHGSGYQPEWDSVDRLLSFTPEETKKIVDLATIRLSNSIVSKYRKYQEKYSKLEHVANKPFVICVAPFEQPLFFAQNDNAIRRVFVWL